MDIITNSEYEVFNDFYTNGELIKEAYKIQGCTKVEENKSIEQIIDTIKEKKDFNLFEFSWFSLLIRMNTPMIEALETTTTILNKFNSEKYIEVYLGEGYIILSGTGKAWKDSLKNYRGNYISRNIYNYLSLIRPNIFNKISLSTTEDFSIQLIDKDLIQLKEKSLNHEPYITDDLIRNKHDWFAVNFRDVSHSFIHEIISFRDLSFSEFNNYLSIHKNFKFSINKTPISKNKTDLDMIENCLKHTQETYNFLVNRGHKRDVIRQILPIGMTKNILVGNTVENWDKLFKEKTKDNSHWEIKTVLNDLKDELNENYNYKF